MKKKDFKFLELNPEKEYILIVKRSSVSPRDLIFPKDLNYNKPIRIIWVDNMEDIMIVS